MLVYIQVLGFLAAFAVVAFHAWGVTPQGYKVPDNFVSFVLSGGGRGMSMVTLIPGIPPLLLVLAISCIVAALGLLLNISVERPSLKLVRRLDMSGWRAVKAAVGPSTERFTAAFRTHRSPAFRLIMPLSISALDRTADPQWIASELDCCCTAATG